VLLGWIARCCSGYQTLGHCHSFRATRIPQRRRTERSRIQIHAHEDSTNCWPTKRRISPFANCALPQRARTGSSRLQASVSAADDTPLPLGDEESSLLPSSNAETDDEKSSSVVGATFSLMKTLVGTGMLALPSGLAVVSDQPSMLWSANAMLLGLGALSAYTFWSLGRLANATGGRTCGHECFPDPALELFRSPTSSTASACASPTPWFWAIPSRRWFSRPSARPRHCRRLGSCPGNP
jgi:hypothetical protein